MNDDDLGRALRTALAPPDLRATPDAGSRLRVRARRQGTRRAVAGTVAAGLAVLLAVGLVRAVGTPDPAPTGSSWPGGPARLAQPLEFRTDVMVSAVPCPSPGVLVCTPPPQFLTVDEVRGLRVVPDTDAGPVVEVALDPADAQLLAAVAAGPGSGVRVRVGGTEHAVRGSDPVRVPVADAAAGEALVGALGPTAPVPYRPGPGRLTTALELWEVVDERSGPCFLTPVDLAGSVRTVDTPQGCLVLSGPVVRLATVADLQVGPGVVTVDPAGADRAALDAFTRAHVGGRVAFLAGGHFYGAPEIEGPFGSSVQVAVADRAAAESLAARLRS